MLLCFKTTEHFEESAFVEALKTAVAGVVWDFLDLCGSIILDHKGKIQCMIPAYPEIQVKVVHHEHLDADKLDAAHWPPHTLISKEVTLMTGLPIANGVGMWNFAVQANILNGGLILALHMNHCLQDGLSLTNMNRLFAHHFSRAMDGKPPTKSGMFPPEALERSRAYATHPARDILAWKDWVSAPQKPVVTPEQHAAGLFAHIEKLQVSVWHLTPEKLDRLRAAFQDPSKPRLSTATCIAIWFWRVATRARGLPPDATTRLFTPTQVRGRVKELPYTYAGNAVVNAYAKATVAEVLSLSPNELGRRVNDGISWWTPELIREYWGSIESCEDLSKVQRNMNRDFGADVETTNFANCPFYEVDWSKALELKASRLTSQPFSDGFYYVLPRLRSGGYELFTYMAKETFRNFLKDTEFRNYVEYWGSSDASVDVLAAASEPTRSKL